MAVLNILSKPFVRVNYIRSSSQTTARQKYFNAYVEERASANAASYRRIAEVYEASQVKNTSEKR